MRDMLDAAAPVPLPAAGTPPGLSPAGTAGPGPPPPPDVAVTRQRAQALAEEGTARADAATAEPPEVQALLAHHGLDWRTGMSDGLPGGLAAFAATGTAASAAVDDLVADLAGVFFTPAAAHAGYPTPAPPTQPVAYGATARPAAGAAPPRVTAPPKTAGGTKRAARDKTPPLAYDSDSDDDGDAAPALTKVDLPGGVTHELFEVMSRGRTPEPAALRKLLGKAPPLRPLELAPNATMRADVHPTLRPAAWRDDVFDSAALHNDHWFREYAKLHGVARAESAWLAEVKGIYGQGTVGEVELPLDARVQVLKCHSVYKRKPPSVNFPDGRDKARAVVGGDKQVDGVDTSRHERPAPTGMCLSQRMLDILAVTTGRRLRVVDVKMAFLNAPMGKLIYVQPLNGVNLGVGPNGRPIVWVLFTALYGIAEAPQAWYLEYARFLESIGYRRTTADMALFVRVDEATAEVHMCLVHVDDTKMLMSDVEQARFIAALLAGPAKAGIDDLGSDFGECCGVGYDVTPRGYHLHLRRFIDACAERFNLRGASPCSTPLPERVDPVGDAEHAALSPGEIKLWEQIVGCLQWAATTQVVPGLAFSSSFLGTHRACPIMYDLQLARHAMRWLIGQRAYGVRLERNPSLPRHLALEVSSDSSHASCKRTLRSHGGLHATLGGLPLATYSGRMASVALSSTAAEIAQMSESAKFVVLARRLLACVGCRQREPTVLRGDNTASILALENQIMLTEIGRHIQVRYMFCRELVGRGVVSLAWVRTHRNVSDVATKALGALKFAAFNRVITGHDYTWDFY